MKTFRIYGGFNSPSGVISEESFQAFLTAEVASRFEAFSVIPSSGYWQGLPEQSYILEILSDDTPAVRQLISEIADLICSHFNQDAVLVSASDTTSSLVTRRLA